MKRFIFILSIIILLAGSVLFSGRADAESVLVREFFNDGRDSVGSRGWVDKFGDPDKDWYLEVYSGEEGFSLRGLDQYYDHDRNPLTRDIKVQGGLEMLSNVNANTMYREFTLPEDFGYEADGTFSFFATHRRHGGKNPLVSVYNVSDERYLLAPTRPIEDGGEWNYNEYKISFSREDLGDTLQLRFSDRRNTIDSMEIASVKFAVTAPEPGVLFMFLLSGMGLAIKRFFR